MWNEDIESNLDAQAAELEIFAVDEAPPPSATTNWAQLVTSLVVVALAIGGPFVADGTWTCGTTTWGGCR